LYDTFLGGLRQTVINTVTNLVEIIRVVDKISDTIARRYAQCCLSHYPWPQRCVHDPGGEFIGVELQSLLQDCHIRDVCTSAKNPQSNATLPALAFHLFQFLGGEFGMLFLL
jgi:hypothetical protein